MTISLEVFESVKERHTAWFSFQGTGRECLSRFLDMDSLVQFGTPQLTPIQQWASCITSLCLSLLICKVGTSCSLHRIVKREPKVLIQRKHLKQHWADNKDSMEVPQLPALHCHRCCPCCYLQFSLTLEWYTGVGVAGNAFQSKTPTTWMSHHLWLCVSWLFSIKRL